MKHQEISGLLFEVVLENPNRGSSRLFRLFGKRILDLSLSILLLPIFLLLTTILLVLSIKTKGPLFYAQQRVGKNGKVFKCWKFRTMVMDAEAVLQDMIESDPKIAAEWHETQKLDNDPRIIRLGGFLRKTSLDELPQLINIFRGDMSIVGPRPFMVDQEEMYREAGGAAYFDLRPGVTGLWQINDRNNSRFVERIGYDESYLRHFSFGQDISILYQTVGVVLRSQGK